MVRTRQLLVFCIIALGLVGSVRGDEPIEKLILQLEQPLQAGRVDAAQTLASYGTDAAQATDALIRALGDRQNDLRVSAAYALACVQTDSPRALNALVPLLTDTDEHVRYSAQWSIAHIAKSLKANQEPAEINELVSTLRQAIKEMRPREHQERHLVALELALTRLEQMLPPKVITVTSADSEEVLRARAMAENMYDATDAVGRYHFVRRLADMDAYPDTLRRLILEKETRQADPSVLAYALKRWGGRGRVLLGEILEERLKAGTLSDEDSHLLSEMTPATPAQRQQILQIAIDRSSLASLRYAAIEALGRSSVIESELITGWMRLIEDEQSDMALRCAALEAMAELGSRAHEAQPQLLVLLPRVRDESMFASLAHALVAVAPSSAPVCSVLRERLAKTGVDSPLYVDLVEACRGMGPAAAVCEQEFLRGLSHNDVYTRTKCIEALHQIGARDTRVIEALLDRIVDPDEEIATKNAAAETLASMRSDNGESTGLPAIAKRLDAVHSANNRTAVVDLLRALAIVGGQGDAMGQRCLALLNDPQMDLETRVAAATALGSLRPGSHESLQSLDRVCQVGNADELRSAALIAFAQLDPVTAARHLEAFAAESSILLRTTAAYARHLTGESKQAFDELVALIDGSETDPIIARCLADMGSVIAPWLIASAADIQALPACREICFSLACESANPDWSKLLPLVEDPEVGNKFVMIAEGLVQSDEGIECLLDLLESGRMRPIGQSRLVELLFPDGLGAGADDVDWKGLTIQQPGSRAALAARSLPDSAEMPEAAMPSAPSAPVKREPTMPRIEVPLANDLPREHPEIVRVFYGTNRGRAPGNDKQETAVAVLATAGGGMLAMLFCLVGFIRSGHRFYAVLALLAMGLASPFGYQAALKYSNDALRPSIQYDGSYQKAVELGICEVSIPPGHKPGELESPQMFKLQFKQELDKHVVLTRVTPLADETFFDNMHETLSAKGKNILVFIHGYNVSFEDAARRTAQMSFDLKFAGAPVFYSWPSQANWYGYPTDRKNIELSVNQIKQFLVDLAQKSGAETINLVAHSMGNVGLTQALKEIELTSPEPMFNQVVLAAPDVDADIFKERIAPAITRKAKHVTLYTSQTDLALIASRYFNQGPRIGDSTDGVPLLDGIETIDATSIDSSLIGHSYYGSNVTVLTDLGNVLMNRPASSREYLQTILSTPHPYWTFDSTRLSQTQDDTTTR